MGKKIAPGKFRKLFLARVRGNSVSVEALPSPPLILEPTPPVSYWINRLAECEAISQKMAKTLEEQNNETEITK